MKGEGKEGKEGGGKTEKGEGGRGGVGGKGRERWVEGRGRREGGKEKGSGLRALGIGCGHSNMRGTVHTGSTVQLNRIVLSTSILKTTPS